MSEQEQAKPSGPPPGNEPGTPDAPSGTAEPTDRPASVTGDVVDARGATVAPVDATADDAGLPILEQKRRGLRIGVQTIAFLIGILLLWWCARQALSEDNRAQIQRLGEASITDVAAIAGLSLLSIILNGLVFWVAMRPVKRLSIVGTVATNALASFLNYLPFKLSILCRVLIHSKRDGVPLLTIGAWFAGMGAVLLATYGPLVSVSLWRRGIDWVWLAAGFGGVALGLATIVLVARLFAGARGRDRIERLAERMLDRIDARIARCLMRTRVFARLHAGLDMLASPWAVCGESALWLGDLGVQATRFTIAAGILGVALPWQDALLVASCYFLIGVASPAGQLGTREAGTTAVAGVLGLAGGEDLAVVMLLASAVESVVSLLSAGAAIVWLRPDQIFWGKKRPALAATEPRA